MATGADFADELEIFFGEASDAQCLVYARLRGPRREPELKLSGTLTGPKCRYANTLEATYRFVDCGPGVLPLARAIVPEPCFWTPHMPHCYQARLTIGSADGIVGQVDRVVGLRTLGVRRRDLMYDGKRWVLRAVSAKGLAGLPLTDWRDADAAMSATSPDVALCQAASEAGVLLVADLANSRDGDIDAQLSQLARWPAVGIAIVPHVVSLEGPRPPANLLLAQSFDAGQTIRPASWAHLVVCDVDSPPDFAARVADSPLPVIARHSCGPSTTILGGRGGCDRLQRDLAGLADVAGYIV